MAEFTTNDLKGRNVIDQNGNRVGSVDDIVFDPEHWEIQSLLVELEEDVAKDLNVKKKGLFGRGGGHLAISRHRVETVGENVILNVDRHDMADLLRRHES